MTAAVQHGPSTPVSSGAFSSAGVSGFAAEADEDRPAFSPGLPPVSGLGGGGFSRWLVKLASSVLVIGVLIFGVTLLRVWLTGNSDDRRPSDAIVVMGASQFNCRPTEVFADRLAHAAELYHQHVAPRIVVTGGKLPGDKCTEGQSGVQYLQKAGTPGGAIPASALVPVGEGSDSLTSLQAVATVMDRHGWHSAVIVTDPWHELRSRTMANDLGIDAVSSPVTVGPSVSSRPVEGHYILRETLGYLYYAFFHDSSHTSTQAI